MREQKHSANRKKRNALHSCKQLTLRTNFLFDGIGLPGLDILDKLFFTGK